MSQVEPGQLRRWEKPYAGDHEYELFMVISENPVQLLGPDNEPVRSFKVMYSSGLMLDHWIDDLVHDPVLEPEPNPDGYSVLVIDEIAAQSFPSHSSNTFK